MTKKQGYWSLMSKTKKREKEKGLLIEKNDVLNGGKLDLEKEKELISKELNDSKARLLKLVE